MTRTMDLYVRCEDDRSPDYRVSEEFVAVAEVVWSTTIEPEDDVDDMCEPRTSVYRIKILCGSVDPETVREAIKWTHRTKGGCGHDWDCCGCRSYYVGDILQSGDEWIFEVHSSRNF